MKADPWIQLRLLNLQALDSAIERLGERRRSLPEVAATEALSERLTALRDDVVRAETEVSDIARVQSRLENEVEMVRTRAARDRTRLESGQISSPKELANLQSEVTSLTRRQTSLEDDLLEVMENREVADARAGELRKEADQVGAERDEVAARRDAAFAEIDTEAAAHRAERATVAPTLPDPLIALYDRIRATSGGVGAAALVRHRCEGCHLELSGADLRALAAAPVDEVVRCEECRRILVRTAESGL
ncbi:MAG: zinc ribbon domain-containing protein [Frankia sp.]